MNYHHLVESFASQGYLHLSSVFAEALMTRINRICLEHFGMNPDWAHTDEFITASNCEIVPWFPLREGVGEFREIEEHKELNQLTKAVLGEGWNSLYCMSMFSKQGTAGQAWHQDSPPDDPKQFNLNRLVYTHDISEETGGQVVVVPGSHRRGIISVGDPNEVFDDQVVLNPKKGDLVILHGHCWHSVLPVTGAYRLSTNFRAMPAGTPAEITDTAIYRNMKYYFPTNQIIENRVQ